MSVVFMVVNFVKSITCDEGPTVVTSVNCIVDFQFSELLNSWFAIFVQEMRKLRYWILDVNKEILLVGNVIMKRL